MSAEGNPDFLPTEGSPDISSLSAVPKTKVEGKKVTFSEKERLLEDDELSLSSGESFCEIITTSEAESLSSSGEEGC